MGQPAAKQGDQVLATDTHIIMIPSPGGPVPTPLPHPFTGQINDGLSSDVNIEGMPAAVQGSKDTNIPSHIPKRGAHQTPPANQAEIQMGSRPVYLNGKAAARNGDMAMTCNDPADLPAGTVMAVGTVMIGG